MKWLRIPLIYAMKGEARAARMFGNSVVFYVLKQGMTPEELVKVFTHLTLSQVYDALSYYYDNKERVECDLSETSVR